MLFPTNVDNFRRVWRYPPKFPFVTGKNAIQSPPAVPPVIHKPVDSVWSAVDKIIRGSANCHISKGTSTECPSYAVRHTASVGRSTLWRLGHWFSIEPAGRGTPFSRALLGADVGVVPCQVQPIPAPVARHPGSDRQLRGRVKYLRRSCLGRGCLSDFGDWGGSPGNSQRARTHARRLEIAARSDLDDGRGEAASIKRDVYRCRRFTWQQQS